MIKTWFSSMKHHCKPERPAELFSSVLFCFLVVVQHFYYRSKLWRHLVETACITLVPDTSVLSEFDIPLLFISPFYFMAPSIAMYLPLTHPASATPNPSI
uniref:Uncharacterized protein n=1 Tax=Ditylum brightwellii TaxID=49249 RepID=A0A7S4WFM8_9STRA|mmetsp:Transcript_14533/g.19394  ORF Transcript_14533/g.19394 Transcript_14533/m.19394 type:complete len:100 (-) Transcript_14533:34-333(-)